jgi:hypothetical protein
MEMRQFIERFPPNRMPGKRPRVLSPAEDYGNARIPLPGAINGSGVRGLQARPGIKQGRNVGNGLIGFGFSGRAVRCRSVAASPLR